MRDLATELSGAGPLIVGPGATIWFTGLPASGKSTVARALGDLLDASGTPTCWLDGDVLRAGLCSDLDFSAAGRRENVRRVVEVALIVAGAGLVSLVSLVSPFAEGRAKARARHEERGIPFLEVWISTPVAECERRDPKGLYARARRGDLRDMTGLGDPYEVPLHADVVIDASKTPAVRAARMVLDELIRRCGLPTVVAGGG